MSPAAAMVGSPLAARVAGPGELSDPPAAGPAAATPAPAIPPRPNATLRAGTRITAINLQARRHRGLLLRDMESPSPGPLRVVGLASLASPHGRLPDIVHPRTNSK